MMKELRTCFNLKPKFVNYLIRILIDIFGLGGMRPISENKIFYKVYYDSI